MSSRSDVLINAAELLVAPDVSLLDVRWALGDPDGHQHYLHGHLPGAVFVDLETDLAAPATTAGGRHPLPAVEDLQHAARSWGLREGRPTVVYDDTGGLAAARAWWLLRWAGLHDVRILDGGLSAWRAVDGPVETGSVEPAPGDVTLRSGGLPTVSADEAATLARTGVLIDARAGERYRGEVEPIDAVAGHVPGAVSLPTAGNLDADARFLDDDALRERFAAVSGTGGIGVYCGSGVTAAHEIAALAAVGIEAALYPGSWSQWSGDSARPVAVGAEPG